jgi:hypothetical protein
VKITKYINKKLQNFWQYVITNQTEPQIEQKSDRDGNLYYRIYDPITRRYTFLASEREVRIWLENRYY